MQKHNTYLIKRFANTEHQLTVVYTSPVAHAKAEIHKALFEDKTVDNIEFIHVPWPQFASFPGHYILKSYLFSKKVYQAIKSKITTFDLIYNKGFVAWYLLNKKEFDIPVISQMHGLEMFQTAFSFKEKLEKWLLRWPANQILKKSNYHFAYGGKIQELLINKGIDKSKIFTQYGAVDQFWLEPTPADKSNLKERKFLFVARYELRKGLKFLHEAILALQNDNLNFTVDIVGAVPENEQLKMSNVTYHGNLNADQLKQLKETSEVLVVPSLSEGFPTVIVEAMARGLCCIASNVGAIASVVDDSNGKIISPGNTNELVVAMKQFIQLNSSELQVLQKNAIEKVKSEFNWEIRFEMLLLHLQNISDDSRKRTHS